MLVDTRTTACVRFKKKLEWTNRFITFTYRVLMSTTFINNDS